MRELGILLIVIGTALGGIIGYLSISSGNIIFEEAIPMNKLHEDIWIGPINLNSVNELHRVVLKIGRTGVVRCNYAARFEDGERSTIWSARGASKSSRRGGAGSFSIPLKTFALKKAGDYYLVVKIGKSTLSGTVRSAEVYVKEKVFGGDTHAFIFLGFVLAVVGMIMIKAGFKR